MTTDAESWKESMKFNPDPEIEKELASLRSMVCLGNAFPEEYRTRYHEAGLRKAITRRASSAFGLL
jgi:YD repeat-containing protein